MKTDDINLAVVSHSYSTFVKDQVDELAECLNRVDVFVTYNRLANIEHYIEIDRLKLYSRQTRIDDKEVPDNVFIHEAPLIYLPTDFHRRLLWYQHIRKLRKAIRQVILTLICSIVI